MLYLLCTYYRLLQNFALQAFYPLEQLPGPSLYEGTFETDNIDTDFFVLC